MTKEEKIKEVYAHLFEEYKHLIDEDGWLDNSQKGAYLTFGQTKHLGDVEYRGDYYLRPKSLSGIENNNGWIKIESEADLPKDSKSYYVKDRFREVPYITIFEEALKDRWLEIITHYQPIVKPKPPIY